MKRVLVAFCVLALSCSACTTEDGTTTTIVGTSSSTTSEGDPIYLDPTASPEDRATDLLSRMTIEEKIGQMTLIEINSVNGDQISELMLGGVLSGGGGYPRPNTVANWRSTISRLQDSAVSTRLGIPLIYGVDSVHGAGLLLGAVLYPQQIGLGATGDPDVVNRVAAATAEETLATGVPWNFGPVVGVIQDIRWGRAYETFGSETEEVAALAAASVEGYETSGMVSTPKHYLADAGAEYGTGTVEGIIDRGDVSVGIDALRAIHLPPYQAAIEAGARSIMVSFSSVDGIPMHAHEELITGVLKGELGFEGFVVSDWEGIDLVYENNYERSVEAAINAGIDMVMVPYNGPRFTSTMLSLYEEGRIPLDRIDDAVLRILRVKFSLGLFEEPVPGSDLVDTVGSVEHLALADEAVSKSVVKLVNDEVLPLSGNETVFVSGQGANDTGIQSGGWSLEWQGTGPDVIPGTTIVDALIEQFGEKVTWAKDGEVEGHADVGIAVVAERPYAEWQGDTRTLQVSEADLVAMENLAQRVDRLIVVVIAGRPVILDRVLDVADAVVMAWLPGSEAGGIVDVLTGAVPFSGRLPVAWPRDVSQLPFVTGDTRTGCDGPLFPIGFGADEADSAVLAACG